MISFLSLRVSRRAIAAARLSDEALAFADGRHLTSRPNRAIVSAINYLTRLLDIVKPSLLVVDGPPRVPGGSTDRILTALEQLARSRDVHVLNITKTEVLAAYGLTGLRSRAELRKLVETFWQELAGISGRVKPYVSEAAAAALYADTRLALERIPT